MLLLVGALELWIHLHDWLLDFDLDLLLYSVDFRDIYLVYFNLF